MGCSDSKEFGNVKMDPYVELWRQPGLPRSLESVIYTPKSPKEQSYLRQNIINIWIYKDQAFPCRHQYVVFQTDSAYWSLEKNKKGVALQFGFRTEDVANCFNRRPRPGPTKLKRSAISGNCITVEELFRFLQLQDVWTFSRLSSNCEHFAQLVFYRVTMSTTEANAAVAQTTRM